MIFKENEILVGSNLLTLSPKVQLVNIYTQDDDVIYCKTCNLDLGTKHYLYMSSIDNCPQKKNWLEILLSSFEWKSLIFENT